MYTFVDPKQTLLTEMKLHKNYSLKTSRDEINLSYPECKFIEMCSFKSLGIYFFPLHSKIAHVYI